MVFHLNLYACKSPQVTRTLLSILADLNNVVVWMVSILPLIFLKFSVYLLIFSLLFSRCGPPEHQNPLDDKFFFLLINSRSNLLAGIRWSVCISKSQRTFFVSVSRTDFGLCIYDMVPWSNFNFLHNSPWITFSTHTSPCSPFVLVCYIRLLYEWPLYLFSIDNSLLLFICVLSIF